MLFFYIWDEGRPFLASWIKQSEILEKIVFKISMTISFDKTAKFTSVSL